MLKQSSSKMKKVFAILFAVLFIASLTAVTASAHGGGAFTVATLGGIMATHTKHTPQIQDFPT